LCFFIDILYLFSAFYPPNIDFYIKIRWNKDGVKSINFITLRVLLSIEGLQIIRLFVLFVLVRFIHFIRFNLM